MAYKLLQLARTKEERDLHKIYGHPGIEGIYGGGCIQSPDMMLVFMNPTARNVASAPSWRGIRAPWIGVQKVWNMLAGLNLIDGEAVPRGWDELSAEKLYTHIAERKLYVTNLASCTQPDARHLSDSIFREYLPVLHKEIMSIKPNKIITLGNQVSSILLQKPISVSSYLNGESEKLVLNGVAYNVYPTYYPVGQGQRNMPKAIKRIQSIIKQVA